MSDSPIKSPQTQSPKVVSPYLSEKSLVQGEEGHIVHDVEVDKSLLAGFSASFINLLKTIVGSGILTLPFALMAMGSVLGISMMFLAGAFCILGLHLINVSAMQLGRKASFSGLCSITYPKLAFIFEFVIALKCIGAGVSYLKIAAETVSKDLVPSLLINSSVLDPTSFVSSIVTSTLFWIIFIALLITPICLMRKMDSLKYTSFGGIAAVLYLVFLVVWNFFNTPGASFTLIPPFTPLSFKLCKAYSTFVFAYTCHQNILPIQNESKENTPSGMMPILASSVGVSTAMYLTVAIFGAATYGTDISDNILKKFGNEFPFVIARFMYVFLLTLSFPLQVFPCRICIEKMALFVNPSFVIKSARPLYYASTFGIITLCIVLSSLDIPLSTIIGWIGATCGTFICYFLPAIIYNKLYSGTPMDWRRISAVVLFIAGCFTLVLSVIGLIMA